MASEEMAARSFGLGMVGWGGGRTLVFEPGGSEGWPLVHFRWTNGRLTTAPQ